jgi:hypothetical protein
MDDDLSECIFTSDDPDITVTISHHRDKLVFGGKVEQDYRFLTYVFPDPADTVEACMYLDDERHVTITLPLYPTPIPSLILTYFQRRFQTIDQLGGSNGKVEIWKWKPSTRHL